MAAGLLVAQGPDETGLRAVARATARSSLVLFLLAYTASGLRAIWNRAGTRWLLRNRRYVGLSMAASHALHLAALVALVRVSGEAVDPATLVAGGLAYAVLAAMAATSFDRSAAWLGPRRWGRLHRAGMHYLWLVFALTMLPAAGRSAWSAGGSLLLLTALALRGVVWARRRQRVLAPSRVS